MTNFKEDNFITGYIRLYRSIANKGWYVKSDYVHLWIHIMIKANHTGKEFFFNGRNIRVNSGQFITGRKQLQIETGINESKIERILTFFEKNEHQIEQQKTTKNRLITVLNWENYQSKKKDEQRFEQQLNNKRTTTEQQLNTNNNDKELNNDNNDDVVAKFSSTLFTLKDLSKIEFGINEFTRYACSQTNFSIEKLQELMQKFISDQSAVSKLSWPNEKDAKMHFINWCKKQVTVQNYKRPKLVN